MILKYSLIVLFLMFTACTDRVGLAPVVEGNQHHSSVRPKRTIVRPGDTLYAIAFRYELDYRHLAAINHLSPPYTVRVGQSLNLSPQQHKRIPMKRLTVIIPKNEKSPGRWLWPARGRVIAGFLPQLGRKGIDIAGRQGDKIYASADGVVAYAGHNLKQYGNLILIKHGSVYLTAYAHQQKNRVHEGQRVKQGEIIADMGRVQGHYWGVHFELRRLGQPINPLKVLK